MRVLPVLLATALFATPALAEEPVPEATITFEADTYRFGDLYRSERGTTIEACAQMCNSDQGCASWTLTPATFRIGPRCELKSTPGTASHQPGAASGMSAFWQLDPSRHGEMKFQPSVPEGRQPAAVPLEQLRPSPVPRIFGDPLPAQDPELLGGPGTPVSTVTSSTETIELVGEPVRAAGPDYVKQPPLPPSELDPVDDAPMLTETAPAPRTVFKDPALDAPIAPPAASTLNAVVRRENQTPTELVPAQPATDSVPAAEPETQPIEVLTPPEPPAPPRTPWTERDGTDPNYSVGDTGYVPGDEDATAGFVDGLPEDDN